MNRQIQDVYVVAATRAPIGKAPNRSTVVAGGRLRLLRSSSNWLSVRRITSDASRPPFDQPPLAVSTVFGV